MLSCLGARPARTNAACALTSDGDLLTAHGELMSRTIESVLARVTILLFISVVVLMQEGCSQPTEPHSDVRAARRVWLASNVTDYTFELAITSSWVPKSDYYRIRVAGRKVIAVTTPGGERVENLTLTIDDIWDALLAARASGDLNSVVFNSRGVPVETDMGDWPVDAGVHYSVRKFVPSR